jgi:hypothetical protein
MCFSKSDASKLVEHVGALNRSNFVAARAINNSYFEFRVNVSYLNLHHRAAEEAAEASQGAPGNIKDFHNLIMRALES